MKIDKNIPVPLKKRGELKTYGEYPWEKLEVGDSFLVEEEYSQSLQQTLVTMSRAWSKRNYNKERKFASRKVEEGIRIWRIK